MCGVKPIIFTGGGYPYPRGKFCKNYFFSFEPFLYIHGCLKFTGSLFFSTPAKFGPNLKLYLNSAFNQITLWFYYFCFWIRIIDFPSFLIWLTLTITQTTYTNLKIMPRQKAHTESDKSTHLLTSFHYSRRQLAAACIL